jgi:hypothetical protein
MMDKRLLKRGTEQSPREKKRTDTNNNSTTKEEDVLGVRFRRERRVVCSIVKVMARQFRLSQQRRRTIPDTLTSDLRPFTALSVWHKSASPERLCYRARYTMYVRILRQLFFYYYYYLFTAIGVAPGGSSPTLVQTKTIKQHYTVVQHNTIKRKHNTIKRKHRKIKPPELYLI